MLTRRMSAESRKKSSGHHRLGLRKRARPRVAVALLVSLIIAASLGLLLYAVTSLTFMASEPLSDPRFGPQNACALKELKDGRTGFAVGPRGAVAVYSGASIVLCDEGKAPAARLFELSGVTSAAIDFTGTLWVARRSAEKVELHVLRAGEAGLQVVGELSPVALAGHRDGVLALESSGRLVSVSSAGEVLAVAQLPEPPQKRVELATNADGTLVSLTTSGGLFVLEVKDLSILRAEAPCDVEWAWWLAHSEELLLSCGPSGSFSIKLNARSGEREETGPSKPRPSVRVPLLGQYVEDCGALPCSTRPPI